MPPSSDPDRTAPASPPVGGPPAVSTGSGGEQCETVLLRARELERSGVRQAFDERYVWENEPRTGARQIRQIILVSDREIKLVINMLDCYFSRPNNLPSLEELARQLIKIDAGDVELKDTNGQGKLRLLSKKYGISFPLKLADYLRLDRPREQAKPKPEWLVMQEFQKKWLLLQDILDERTCQYEIWTAKDQVGLTPIPFVK